VQRCASWSAPRPSRLRVLPLAAALLLYLLISPIGAHAEGDNPLSELKVAFVYNFTRFVQWPKAPAGRPFVIGVIGDPAMEGLLRVLEREGKRVDGRPIEIRAYTNPETVGSSEILFVGAGAEDKVAAIVRGAAGKPTLLVGDIPGFAGRGGAIELFRKPDIFRKSERLRLRIDPAALKGRGLIVSAQLYDVAEILQ
jgi:hypothetical protein